MSYLQMKLDKLATSLRILKDASAILFIITTTDERGQMLYESLKKVDSMVKDLDDEILTKLYNKIFSVFLSGVPHQQIIPDDYFPFLQRIGTLLDEATSKANEAHISLREAIRHEAVIGVWEGRAKSSSV